MKISVEKTKKLILGANKYVYLNLQTKEGAAFRVPIEKYTFIACLMNIPKTNTLNVESNDSGMGVFISFES